jgi:hypothetical protein
MLSAFPSKRIRVGCDRCSKSGTWDRDDMLAAGGDRALPRLLTEFARHLGCERIGAYDRCRATFPELPRLLREAGEF